MLNKSRIAQSFSRAASRYDSVASLQRDIGQALFKTVPPQHYQQIVDLGSGTGHFVNALQPLSHNTIIAADLAEGMLQYNQQQQSVRPVCCDAEQLPFADHSLGLIFSNLALQWCYQLPQLFSELQRVLSKDGQIVLSTLLPNTLTELNQSWASVDQQVHVNTFLPATDWLTAAQDAGLTAQQQIQQFDMHYAHPIDLLKELRTLGAHNVAASVVSRSKLNAMLAYYQQHFAQPQGYVASYQVLFMQLTHA